MMHRSKRIGFGRLEALEGRQLLAGTVTPKLVAVPISSAALAADPNLSNYATYDLQVTVTGDADWATGDLKAVLTTGNFYSPPTSNGNQAQSGLWASKPNVEFDTFVTAPNYTNAIILGSYNPGSNTAVTSSTEWNIVWGDFPKTGAGTFTIARLTMTKNAVGSLEGRVGNILDPQNPTYFAYAVPVGNQITGKLWNDADKDGVIDSAETALTDWQVWLDTDNDGTLDASEKSVKTNSKGNYIFSGLADGTYRVRAKTQSGWTRSFPTTSSVYNVAVSALTNATDKNFGFYQGTVTPTTSSIAGKVWNDADADGNLDSTEVGIASWQVYLDANNNGKLDTGETSLRTNSKGDYKFSGLSNGTYKVRQNSASGYRRTFPVSSGVYTVAVSNGTAATGKNFGNTRAILISGTVWRDLDKDGVRDAGDPGLSGWTVYIDKDGDGKFDTGETTATTASDGTYSFKTLGGGTYTVRLVVDTTKWKLTTKSSHLLIMSPGQTTSGKDFGVKKL